MDATQWQRYGHDRTYLATDDGRPLGYIDNATGEIHANSDADASAIRMWRDHDESRDDAVDVASILEEPAESPTGSIDADVSEADAHSDLDDSKPGALWVDLADQSAGQAARIRAEAEFAAMREKSKLVTGVLRFFDAKTDERAWRVGAAGEETVGAKLEKLRSHGWFILHAVPIGNNGADIDHLLVGPGGVWTLNTKNHPGKKVWVSLTQVRVDGRPVPYLRNSEFEAQRVQKILTNRLGWEVPVHAALIFLTGTLIPDVKIVDDPENVMILDRANATFVLRRRPRVLSDEQVLEVYELARRSTTWA